MVTNVIVTIHNAHIVSSKVNVAASPVLITVGSIPVLFIGYSLRSYKLEDSQFTLYLYLNTNFWLIFAALITEIYCTTKGRGKSIPHGLLFLQETLILCILPTSMFPAPKTILVDGWTSEMGLKYILYHSLLHQVLERLTVSHRVESSRYKDNLVFIATVSAYFSPTTAKLESVPLLLVLFV